MLGAWRIAPCFTLRLRLILVDNSNSPSLSFSKRRLKVSRSSFFCSSSSPTTSFTVADEEKEKLNESTKPPVPPNLPIEGKPIGETEGPSGIRVPRQKHIPVSKPRLLEALLNTMLASQQPSADQFLLISSCLDSILHAEHKRILEEMRADYFLVHSTKRKEGQESEEEGERFPDVEYGFDNMDNTSVDNCLDELNDSQGLKFPFHVDLMRLFGSPINASPINVNEESRR